MKFIQLRWEPVFVFIVTPYNSNMDQIVKGVGALEKEEKYPSSRLNTLTMT